MRLPKCENPNGEIREGENATAVVEPTVLMWTTDQEEGGGGGGGGGPPRRGVGAGVRGEAARALEETCSGGLHRDFAQGCLRFLRLQDRHREDALLERRLGFVGVDPLGERDDAM